MKILHNDLRNMTSVYISQNNKMLMLYRVGSSVISTSWCGIGGNFENDELNNATACVLRELYEEMQISESDLINLKMRYITIRLKNNEIRQIYYFFADLKPDVKVNLTSDEGVPEWIDYDAILDKEMPFTAKIVLKHYLDIGRYNDNIYGCITTKNNSIFTRLEEF